MIEIGLLDERMHGGGIRAVAWSGDPDDQDALPKVALAIKDWLSDDGHAFLGLEYACNIRWL